MVAFALALAWTQELGRMITIGTPDTAESMVILMNKNRLEPPKFSPKDKLMFEWLTSAFARSTPDSPGTHPIRFRVFSQERRETDDRAISVARTLLQLWQQNYLRLRVDHSTTYNNRIVDVYLTWGGKAGGEQKFDQDDEGDRARAVNTIYIYDLKSFINPVEMLREIAHEYGHASLPPVGR